MKHAIIENGVVVNTALADPDFAAEQGWIAAEDASIGDLWDGDTFTRPPPHSPKVPAAISMRQARLALLEAGLLQQVNDAIDAMTGAQGEAALIEWEYAQEVRRDSPLVQELAPALGLTDEQIDGLFIAGAGL